MKVKIIKTGKIEGSNLVGWSFDSFTNVPALSVSGKGILYYGYTLRELEEISSHAVHSQHQSNRAA